MPEPSNIKRPLLYALIGSVVVGAILGIILVLRNEWGWFEVRVIITTITVAIASLSGLACDLTRTPRGSNFLPLGGLGLTFISAGMILVAMWSDIENELYWKSTAVVSIFAVATVHICLLSIAKLSRRFSWIFFITLQVIYGLAILISILIVWEINDDRLFRFIVTVSIVSAALTLVIPLLHRISKADSNPNTMITPLGQRSVVAIDQDIAQLKERISHLEKLKAELTGGAANTSDD